MVDDPNKTNLGIVPNGGFVFECAQGFFTLDSVARAKAALAANVKRASYQTDPKWAAKILAEDVRSEPPPYTGVTG